MRMDYMDRAAEFVSERATEHAAESIRAALRELGRAQAVAARLVAAAECRLHDVVDAHTAAGSITPAQAAALLAVGGVPEDSAHPDPGAWPAADGIPGPRDDGSGGAAPTDWQRTLSATRLPSREEILPPP